MNLVVLAELSAALLEMLNLVETRILNLRRKTLLYSTACNVNYKHAGRVQATNVLLQRS